MSRSRRSTRREPVGASLVGEIGRAVEKLGANVGEVNPVHIAGTVGGRWLGLSPEVREPAALEWEGSAGMDLGL